MTTVNPFMFIVPFGGFLAIFLGGLSIGRKSYLLGIVAIVLGLVVLGLSALWAWNIYQMLAQNQMFVQ